MTLRRAPVEGLTFEQILAQLRAESAWKDVDQDDLRAALDNLEHKAKAIEQQPDGRYRLRES